jgi:hypothetical protein
MAGTWVRVAYEAHGEGLFYFVARIEGDLAATIFDRKPDEFVRFDFVRWLDAEEEDINRPEFSKNEEDDESGSDHYVYLRQRSILQVEPIREAFVEFWNATIAEGGALW